jgi:nucleoside-diphosphate-sugar epimerase
LEAGLTVHCAVRSPNNAEKVQHLVDAVKGTKGELKFFKADLLDEGSYEEAMKGCSVVFHTASPFNMSVDPAKVDEQLFDPAIKGTKNVLTSVSKTSSVKRVVLTSSVYATMTDAADCLDEPNQALTEDSWNKTASRTYNPYAFSKVLAEKEAWKIADAQTQYKLVVVNPGWVMGPGLKCHATSESYSFMKTVGQGGMASGVPAIGVPVVDVRDVAKIHVAAGFSDKAEGRYLAVGHNTSSVGMLVETMAPKLPDYPLPKRSIPWFLVWLIAPYIGMNRRSIWRGVNILPNAKNDKSIKDLDIEYTPMETTLLDMFNQCVDDGMIPKKP